MDSKTTQGTSRASMIILATVVFPEALPPPRPVERGRVTLSKGSRASPAPNTLPAAFLPCSPGLTPPKGPEAAHVSGNATWVLDGRFCLAHRWRRPPWTVCRAHCTRAAVRPCRWYACWCVAGVAQICTGWWCASGVSAWYPRVGGACPRIPHCCCRGGGHACLCPGPPATPPSCIRPGVAGPGVHPTRGHMGMAKLGGLNWRHKNAACSPSTGLLALNCHCPHTFRGIANGIRGNEECHPGPGPCPLR